MKNINKLILAGLVFLPVSCEKFLTEEPLTSVIAEKAYSSEVNIEADVMGIYQELTTYTHSAFLYYLNNGTLVQEWTGNRVATNWIQSHYLTFFSNTNSNKSLFSYNFTGIRRANAVIEGVRKSSESDEYKSEIEAEVRFLRAFFYFCLVRLYGDVPKLDFVPIEVDDVCIPRDRYQDIYKFILDDLNYAFENMRTKEEQERIAPDRGRCYNYAALALKAEVLMWMACYMESPYDQFFDVTKEGRYPDFSACGYDTAKEAWAASLECSERVINDPESPYALESDYRNLFRWDPDNYPEDYRSKERIITVQNTIKSASNTMVGWALWNNPAGTLSVTGHWSNAGRLRPSRFSWQEWGKRHNGVAGGNTTFKNAYTTMPDPRVDVTYQHSTYQSYDEDNAGAIKTGTVFPISSSTSVSGNHFYRKSWSSKINGDNGVADSYIMRMATVYLNAAEAAAALDEDAKAINYLNVLMKRARESVDDPASGVYPADFNAGDFSSKEELINAIMWERVFEQDGEGHAWFDTHRRGANWLIKNMIQPYAAFAEDPMQAGCISTLWVYGREVEGQMLYDIPTDVPTVRAMLLCAYPEYELRYNTSLGSIAQNDFFIE